MDEPNGASNSMKAVGREAETHKMMKPLRMEWNEESQNREDKEDFPYGVRRLLCFFAKERCGKFRCHALPGEEIGVLKNKEIRVWI